MVGVALCGVNCDPVKKQPSIQTAMAILLGLALMAGCASAMTQEQMDQQVGARIAGPWKLQREETLRELLATDNLDYNALSVSDQQTLLGKFNFNMELNFTNDGHWKGMFQEGPNQTVGQGSYRVIEVIDDTHFKIETVETGDEGREEIIEIDAATPGRLYLSYNDEEFPGRIVLVPQGKK